MVINDSLKHMCQTQGPRATSGPWMNYLWPAWQNLFTIRAGPLVYHMRHHNTTNPIMHCPCVGTSITRSSAILSTFIPLPTKWLNERLTLRTGVFKTGGRHRHVRGCKGQSCVSSVRRQCGCNEIIQHKKTLWNEAPRQIQASGHDTKATEGRRIKKKSGVTAGYVH